MLSSPRHFDVSVPCESSEPVIKKILGQLQPEWPVDLVDFKYFNDGISNKLVGCLLQGLQEKDMVMFRLYGNKTELFIDRKKELENVQFLHARGFAPPLLCTFENGFCCGFLPGRTLDTEEMSDRHLSELIAKKLAHVHAIELTSEAKKQKPCTFFMVEKFLRVLPERFSDVTKEARYEKEIASKINIVEEVEEIKTKLSNADLPSAYCHNDLLVKNIIYNKEEDDVAFIDYEYGAYNYIAFDIGNHFNEFGGVVEKPDYDLYPNKEFQFRWLRFYLEEKAKIQGSQKEISEDSLEKLFIQVNQFALASHLFWGVWALLQAHFSSIDFDFLEYAKQRFDEYLLKKDEFLRF